VFAGTINPEREAAVTEWTDDLTVPLPPGRTVAELVDLALQSTLRGTPADEVERNLAAEFGLSDDDAALVLDRSMGGLVRAGTRNPANCPEPDKDPMAWEAFQRGTADPSLVDRTFPQFSREP
jgi:hypothetical protein